MTENMSNNMRDMFTNVSNIGKKVTTSLGGVEYAGVVITVIILFISLIYI